MESKTAHNGLCETTRPVFNKRAKVALNAFMSARGIKNIYLAAALGVHENTITNWRKGREIPAYQIAQLAVFFGAGFWNAVYGDFGSAMKRRYEQRVREERQALHDWSFMMDTGT